MLVIAITAANVQPKGMHFPSSPIQWHWTTSNPLPPQSQSNHPFPHTIPWNNWPVILVVCTQRDRHQVILTVWPTKPPPVYQCITRHATGGRYNPHYIMHAASLCWWWWKRKAPRAAGKSWHAIHLGRERKTDMNSFTWFGTELTEWSRHHLVISHRLHTLQ